MKTLDEVVTTLRESGAFSEDLFERIEGAKEALVKHASAGPALPQGKLMLQAGLGAATGVLAHLGVSSLATYLLARREYSKQREALKKTYEALKNTEHFKANPQLYTLRFQELSLLAPTIASNPTFAERTVVPALFTGFNLDDISKITAIESNSTNRVSIRSPGERVMAHLYSQAVPSATKLLNDTKGMYSEISGTPKNTVGSIRAQIDAEKASQRGVE